MSKMMPGAAGASVKKRFVQLLSSVALLTAVCGAQAKATPTLTTVDYSFTLKDVSGDVATGTLAGTMTGSVLTVTGITGTFDGDTILGLSSYGPPDQTLTFATPNYVDVDGLSFYTANDAYNWSNVDGPLTLASTGFNDLNGALPTGTGNGNGDYITTAIITEVGGWNFSGSGSVDLGYDACRLCWPGLRRLSPVE